MLDADPILRPRRRQALLGDGIVDDFAGEEAEYQRHNYLPHEEHQDMEYMSAAGRRRLHLLDEQFQEPEPMDEDYKPLRKKRPLLDEPAAPRRKMQIGADREIEEYEYEDRASHALLDEPPAKLQAMAFHRRPLLSEPVNFGEEEIRRKSRLLDEEREILRQHRRRSPAEYPRQPQMTEEDVDYNEQSARRHPLHKGHGDRSDPESRRDTKNNSRWDTPESRDPEPEATLHDERRRGRDQYRSGDRKSVRRSRWDDSKDQEMEFTSRSGRPREDPEFNQPPPEQEYDTGYDQRGQEFTSRKEAKTEYKRSRKQEPFYDKEGDRPLYDDPTRRSLDSRKGNMDSGPQYERRAKEDSYYYEGGERPVYDQHNRESKASSQYEEYWKEENLQRKPSSHIEGVRPQYENEDRPSMYGSCAEAETTADDVGSRKDLFYRKRKAKPGHEERVNNNQDFIKSAGDFTLNQGGELHVPYSSSTEPQATLSSNVSGLYTTSIAKPPLSSGRTYSHSMYTTVTSAKPHLPPDMNVAYETRNISQPSLPSSMANPYGSSSVEQPLPHPSVSQLYVTSSGIKPTIPTNQAATDLGRPPSASSHQTDKASSGARQGVKECPHNCGFSCQDVKILVQHMTACTNKKKGLWGFYT